MLEAYRDTPHPATKKTPYELMMNREVRTKLEHFPSETSPKHGWHRVTQLKLEVGQAVIIKREKKRKAETPYEPHIYLVTQVKGSTICARRPSDGKTIWQDASRFKLLKTDTKSTNDEEARMPQLTQIPPAYSSQQPEIAAQRDDAAGNHEDNIQAAPEPHLRRSNRTHRSVFEGHLEILNSARFTK